MDGCRYEVAGIRGARRGDCGLDCCPHACGVGGDAMNGLSLLGYLGMLAMIGVYLWGARKGLWR